MPDYLLPCECGREVVVTRAQAGDTVTCECGAKLSVPTLRGLAELRPAPVAAGAGARSRNWDDRHRVGFLLALGAVTCLLVAGYLWASLPALEVQPSDQDFINLVEGASARELFFFHNEALHGLDRTTPADVDVVRVRQIMSWGIGIVLSMALAASASACIVIWNKPSKK
jgi:hypothetical protein